MTPQQSALMENHIDLAQLSCTGEDNVFWVLDLCDKEAFRIAEGFKSKQELQDVRDKEVSVNKIPAVTLSSDIHALNSYRTQVMGNKPVSSPPPDYLYIVICTEGRFLIVANQKLNT